MQTPRNQHSLARVTVALLISLALSACSRMVFAQFEPAPVFDGAEAAYWIAPAELDGQTFGVFHARRSFEIEQRPERFIVHVSADNRYRLMINGTLISTGPQRSDLMHWRYETVDLAPYLRQGKNLLTAVIWNWGAQRPAAQFSHRTAFLLQGNSPIEASLVNTDGRWKLWHNQAYTALPVASDTVGGYYAAQPGEAINGALYPWGWDSAGFDDSDWEQATPVRGFMPERTRLRGTAPTGEGNAWQLVPRQIPQMEERPIRFATVRRSEGIDAGDGFLKAEGSLQVPANARVSILIDQAHLTNAYPVMTLSGGAGSQIALTYAEALKDADGNKGNRDVISGKTIRGVRDEIYPDGGSERRYQTLWFRTYRYVQLDITTADDALQLHDLHGIFTAYPFELNASFSSDTDWLADMWEINWRVTRLCAGETYYDTPYYEQLQYLGDTRIQALMSLYMSGDDRLVRQAISHFDLSRLPEGITASRYPSELGQFIPTFSLIWVAMVHDYWMHRDDPGYVRSMLPGTRAVLGWFEQRVDDSGLVGGLPWWPFVDWAPEWTLGRPPGAQDGHSVVISLQFVYALQRAAELEQAIGQTQLAERYRQRAADIIGAVRERAWDDDQQLFLDAPEHDAFSQPTNTMAVLVGAVPPPDQARFMQRVLDNNEITQSTYYFSYYAFEALRQAGLAEQYVTRLAPWRSMLELGLTTTPEQPEPTRSDSHAWSAHPNYGLLATVLGIRPAEAGFKRVLIEPALGELMRAEGKMPHPLGEIQVSLKRDGSDGLLASITLPAGLTGEFVWNGQHQSLSSGLNTLRY